jgi:hypothetical protein
MNKQALTISFAIAITITSVLMAAVAAQDRGGSTIDQILLVSLSISVTLLVQFLLSLTRNKLALIVWVLCLAAALFNHLSFFVHSVERAETIKSIKAEDSIEVQALSERIADVSREYSLIDTRTETDITKRLVAATGWKGRSALNVELTEARRKILLSNQLAALKLELAKLRERAGSDAVTSEISRIVGVSPATANVSIGLLFALLVELSGAILWYEYLHGIKVMTNNVIESEDKVLANGKAHKPIVVNTPIISSQKEDLSENTKVAQTLTSKDKDVNAILLAINDGRCRPTAASIRELLSCRTSRAAELNRIVKVIIQTPGAIH